jgi:DEAD/DEAH box helicase domain-containing protein
MDFNLLYQNLNRRAIDALLAMWACGNKDFQKYLRYIFEKEEPLLAEPVFQTTFPWETADATFGELSSVFSTEFIHAIDKAEKNFRFPRSQHPYKHQLESWRKLLIDKKSIVVTSGTGSGKTECFMLPVLDDLYLQAIGGQNKGVGAIFLYPLNALMGSQRKRMLAWTKALDNAVKFAVYNGKTVENSTKNNRDKAFPEIIDRTTIREHPPQILFTNPTMLEYMLVRKSDQTIIDKSQGKLRWILLDEAHTFSGSSAAEIAMLIRRVIDAFGVSVDSVRFAATSATIGGQKDQGNTENGLKRFLAALTGKKEIDIAVIDGKRIAPPLKPARIHATTYRQIKELPQQNRIECFELQNFRDSFNKRSVLSLSEIGDEFKCSSRNEKLDLVQILSENVEIPPDGTPTQLIPLRGHFFIRTVPGVFGCTNPECSKHSQFKEQSHIPTLTTRISTTCAECGFPLLEIISCSSCGLQVLTGEVNEHDAIRVRGYDRDDSFELEELDVEDSDDTEDHGRKQEWSPFWVAQSTDIPIEKRKNLFSCGFNRNTGRVDNGPYLMRNIDDDRCPLCGDRLKYAQHYKAGAPFLSRLLMPSILEQAPPADPVEHGMVWEGRKTLAFTDSRQGTARSAALMNTEVERGWVRTRVFHALAKERVKLLPQSGGLTEEELKKLEIFKKDPVLFAENITELENKVQAANNPDLIPSPRINWQQMESLLIGRSSLQLLNASLTSRKNRGPADEQLYARALLLDQFARRPRRVNSPETLGMVRIVYPDLEKAEAPQIVKEMGFSNIEWRSLLKISIDFVIRENAFIQIDRRVQELVMQHFWTDKIYPSDYDRVPVNRRKPPKRWPAFLRSTSRCSRLALLLCAALEWHEKALIDQQKEDTINQLLQAIWRALRHLGILDGSDDEGYSIDLARKASFELITEAMLCPATFRLLDTSLRGYTPWIKGDISRENIQRYKIKYPTINIPFFPFPDKYDIQGNAIEPVQIYEWLSKNMLNLKEIGIWSDIYERIYLDYPVFLSGEHSAQQADSRLRSLENKFENGRLNLLSCSTTMEMGVDIGGISIVLMNNVPPKPANYLQRAGRAGRRSENRSLSITFCPANPVGEEVLQNPKWALTHSVEMPRVQLTSRPIIQRHINSCLFGMFVRSGGGMKVKDSVEQFFCTVDGQQESNYDRFILWLSTITNEVFATLDKLKINTVLHSTSNNALVARTQETTEKIYLSVQSRINYSMGEINRLITEDSCNEDSPSIRSINYELLRLKNENLLKFLVEEGFLPGAGIPVGVLEFNNLQLEDIYEKTRKNSVQSTDKNEDNSYKRDDIPSNNLIRALTEYAPGRPVILDGWVYKSAGILLQTSFNIGQIIKVRACKRCGHQQMISGDFGAHCPVCEYHEFQGIHNIGTGFSEVIEPAGFSVDIFSSPDRKVEKAVSPHWVEPLLLNMEPWLNESTAVYDIRIGTEDSQILYYSTGEGKGYAVCTECGKTEPIPQDGSNPLDEHWRLRGGKEKHSTNAYCRGNDSAIKIRQDVILGGRISTDICEIRVKNTHGSFSNSEVLIFSFAVALKWEFCKKLGIDDNEIGFGIKKHRIESNEFKSLFLYDTARGGAGYSQQIPDFLDSLLTNIGIRMRSCSCESSCSQCLIDRTSQWYMDQLDRHVLLEWIDMFHATQVDVPEQFNSISEKIRLENRPIHLAIISKCSKMPVKEIRFFVGGSLEEWDIDEWLLVKEMRRRFNVNEVKIRFIIPKIESSGKQENDYYIFSKIISWASIEIIRDMELVIAGGCPLIQIVGTDDTVSSWFSSECFNLPSPNKNWDSDLPEKIFYGDVGQMELPVDKLNLASLKPNMQITEIHFRAEKMFMQRFGLFTITNWKKSIPEIDNIVSGKEINITYNDSYLRGPFGSMLFMELMRALVAEWKVQIQSISLSLGKINESISSFDDRVFRNWHTNKSRREYLIESGKTFLKVENITVKDKEYSKMVHFRYLSISTPTHTITIRPDGGIENGWAVLPVWNFPFKEDVMSQLQIYSAKRKTSYIGARKDVDLLTYIVVENKFEV